MIDELHSEFMEINYRDANSIRPTISIFDQYILVQNKMSDSGESCLLNEKISTQGTSTEKINPFCDEVNADLVSLGSKFAGSAHSNITIREKSVAEVLATILFCPEKQTTKEKRKQSVEHTPTVITSDKWLEIMQAKVNEKKNNEEEKRIKKAEWVERMEHNKKIVEEKLADKIRKKNRNINY